MPGCKLDHARDWSIRAIAEAKGKSCCFVTLTESDEFMRPDRSLELERYQRFWYRLRKRYGAGVRYLGCLEYGEKLLRPHGHFCIFGLDFEDRDPAGKSGSGEVYSFSPSLSALWPDGRAVVQDFTRKTAEYCSRYTLKKRDAGVAWKDRLIRRNGDGEVWSVAPEKLLMSRRPGLGMEWAARFKSDWFPADFIVHDGKRFPVPRAFLSLLSDAELEVLRRKRAEVAAAHAADHREARMLTRDELRRDRGEGPSFPGVGGMTASLLARMLADLEAAADRAGLSPLERHRAVADLRRAYARAKEHGADDAHLLMICEGRRGRRLRVSVIDFGRPCSAVLAELEAVPPVLH